MKYLIGLFLLVIAQSAHAFYADGVTLLLSEDAYKGDAWASVAVDGKILSSKVVVTKLHGKASLEAVYRPVLANGVHTVTVTFLNDLYDGSATTDRNLYVDKALYGSTQIGGPDSLLSGNQSVTYSFRVGPTPAPVGNVPVGYDLILNDDFNTPELDTLKWFTRYVYGGPQGNGTLDTLNDEAERYSEHGNHVMQNGVMNLTAKIDPNVNSGVSSGMIRSKQTFKYGYFEMRAKLPSMTGSWPAFWLNSDVASDGSLGWPPEIDIFEYVNNGVSEHPNMIHMNSVNHGAQANTAIYLDPAFNTQWGYYTAPIDLSLDYHVFGLLWDTDDTLSYFIDGKMIKKEHYNWVRDSGPTPGMAHVLVNYALGGSWAYGLDTSKLPQVMSVDYVRVYQKSGAHQNGVSSMGQNLCPVTGC